MIKIWEGRKRDFEKRDKKTKKILNVLRRPISLAVSCCMIFSLIVPVYAMENEKTKGTSEASTIMDVLISWEDTSLLSLTGK